MATPFKSTGYPHGFGADPHRENPPSNNLWIGNVSPEVSETELRTLFEKYGKTDSVCTYSTRNYAFIYFKDIEGAVSAREGLQGHVLHGISLKIEFAKPAKPCKSLWVAGISPSISKEELEKEFLVYGKIQEFRFLRDRNTAYVDYVGLEDAIQALKNMNGKRMGGSQIRVDFLRSNSSRRELGLDAKEGQFTGRNAVPYDFRWMGQDSLNNYPEPNLSGSKRKNPFAPVGSQFGDGRPSNVLWIKHPPTVILEEDVLHNAMILFGEIERIKTFGDRNYAFVEFRSVEEAVRAKEGLQGKLFNDPRITIEYFSDEFPFQPAQMDTVGLNRPVGRLSSVGMHGSDLYMRPLVGHHSTFEPQNHSPQTMVGGATWRRSSPTPGLASSPSASFNAHNKPESGPWDTFDANQHHRESKRSRFVDADRTEIQGEQYRPHSLRNGEASGSLTRGKVGRRHADCLWRGLIAKGGTPVCRARCVPVGEMLGTDIPDVVNCSARTGLDLLSKHYDDAIGFGIVSFLPDSEDDFASYTEFLRYLGSKDRAGVAKFDDGATLFLVPPSDFLRLTLGITGPPRLYGVVLKFPQVVVPNSLPLNPQSVPPHYADPPKMPTLQRGYGAVTTDERRLHLDNSRVLPEDSFSGQAVPPTITASQAGLALTPELIASLTSLLPANGGSSGVMSNVDSGVVTNAAHWKHENRAPNHGGHSHINPHLQHQTLNSYGQIHDHRNNLSSQGPTSSLPLPPVIPFQSGPDMNQHYQQHSSQGINNGSDSLRPSYNNAVALPQPYIPESSEVGPTHQGQPHQTASYGTNQENAETEADKNERYKSTLLFAANLLSKIHQPPGNQPGHDAGSH